MTHFNTHAHLAVFEHASRGVTVRAGTAGWPVQLLLHNGCGRGNMLADLTADQALDIGLALVTLAREAQKAQAERLKANREAARKLKLPSAPVTVATL